MIRMLLSSETGDRLVDMELSVEWTSMRKPSRCRQGRSRRAFAIPTRGMNWPTSSCVPTSADIRKVMAKPTTCQATISFFTPAFEAFKGADQFKYRLPRAHALDPAANQIAARIAICGTVLAARLRDRRIGRRSSRCRIRFCGEFGFDGDVRSARHIATWIELLNADKRAFFTACNEASKAAGYLRGLALADSAEKSQRSGSNGPSLQLA